MTYIIVEYRPRNGSKQIDLVPLEEGDGDAKVQAAKLRTDYEEVNCVVERIFVAEQV